MRHLFAIIGQDWLTLRERREINFADAQKKPNLEREKQAPTGDAGKDNPVQRMSQEFRQMLAAAAPEMSVSRGELVRSEEVATYAGFDAESEAKVIAKEWGLPISEAWASGFDTWEQAVEPDTRERMQQELDRRREAAMEQALQDGEMIRGLVKDVDDRIARAEELGNSIEQAIKLEMEPKMDGLTLDEKKTLREELKRRRGLIRLIPSESIALVLAGTPQAIQSLTSKLTDHTVQERLLQNPLDSDAIAQALNLSKYIPKPEDQKVVLDTLIRALNHTTKLQNFGRPYHRKEELDAEGWSAWKRDYVSELQKQRGTLLEQLHMKLEQRYEQFVNAETERLLAILRTLNLTEDDMRRIHEGNAAAFEEAERRSLQRYGVGLSAFCRRMNERAVAAVAIDKLVSRTTGEERLPSPEDPDFLTRADQMFQTMKQLENDTERLDPSLENFAADLQIEQQETEERAVSLARRVRSLLAKGHATSLPGIGSAGAILEQINADIGKYADAADPTVFRKDYPACVTPERMTDDEWQRMESAVVLLERAGTTLHEHSDSIHSYLEQSKEGTALSVIEEGQLATRAKIGTLIEGILPTLDAPLCRTLHLDRTMKEKASHLEGLAMRAAASAEKANHATDAVLQGRLMRAANDDWTQVQREIKQLETLQEELASLQPENAVYEPDSAFPSEDELGFFDAQDRKIHLRNSLKEKENDERRKAAWLHEKGHATLNLLRESGVLPFYLLSEEHTLSERLQQSEGVPFEDLLKQLTEYYHIDKLRTEFQAIAEKHFENNPSLAAEDAKKIEREYLLEELFSRFADARDLPRNAIADNDPKREQKLAEQRLFDMLREGDLPHTVETSAAGRALRRGRLYTNGTPNSVEGEEMEQGTGSESDEISNVKNALLVTDTMIRNINAFFDAYQDTNKPNVRKFIDENTSTVGDLQQQLEIYDERFRAQETVTLAEIDEIRKQAKDILKEVNDFDRLFWDIQKEKVVKKETWWDSFRFMSVYDVIKLWKDLTEDFKTMYNRNQQRLLQDVGNAVYDALTKQGGKIPVVGSRYFAKLKGYHERRYADAELESVGKWKKAMEKLDTHSILHILGNTGNLDQIRGCIEMVCDRGEMDWNDTGVWKTLMKISGYNMPVKACLRDDILRDTWLRKMISKTWKDAELFYKWRSNNDSNTESHKKKFIQQVDQYSNVSGGLAGNLKRQLELFTQWKNAEKYNKEHGLPPPHFPDDVKPHLYEQVIEYSIKNGKMSMEDKMFYIVQGIASGLLPIERLRALAGQHGSIINLFPYIEYFYAHNNSLPEIEALAKRLKEPGNEFEPGLRTTLWIHFEVSRDEQVRRRLSKGSTRKAEDIDHEDIPFFVTQMDYSEMSNMLDVISGGRQKVTPEGLKNAYVGFNSKMKILGSLAKMEDNGLERFTGDDAATAAKNLAAYILMDNSLTMNGIATGKKPPTLSLSQFKTQAVSSANNETAWQYRQRMSKFIQVLNRRGIFDGIKWEGDPAVDRETLGVKKGAMLNLDDHDPNEGYQRNSEADVKRILSDSVFPRFAQQLEKAIKGNLTQFKAALKECEGFFLNEGGSAGLTYDKVREIKTAERREAERNG